MVGVTTTISSDRSSGTGCLKRAARMNVFQRDAGLDTLILRIEQPDRTRLVCAGRLR